MYFSEILAFKICFLNISANKLVYTAIKVPPSCKANITYFKLCINYSGFPATQHQHLRDCNDFDTELVSKITAGIGSDKAAGLDGFTS